MKKQLIFVGDLKRCNKLKKRLNKEFTLYKDNCVVSTEKEEGIHTYVYCEFNETQLYTVLHTLSWLASK